MKVVYWRNREGILFGEVRGLRLHLWLAARVRRRNSAPPPPRHLHTDLGLPEPVVHQPAHLSLTIWR